MNTLFAVIAMIAITNTTLVAVVTQPRILYGMANEDIVPGVFAKIHAGRRSPWVGLLFSGGRRRRAARGRDADPRPAPGSTSWRGWPLVTVLFLLFIYALVIVSALKLRGQDEDERTYRANTPLLFVGLVGNLAILVLVDQRRPVVAGLVRRPGRGGCGAVPARVLLRPAGPARGCGAGRPEPEQVGLAFPGASRRGWVV